MLAGDLNPGDIVELVGDRTRRYVAAAPLAGRAAIELVGPGDRRGGLSGASVWLALDEPVILLERYQPRAAAGGSEYDPLQSGYVKNLNDSVSAPTVDAGSGTSQETP